MGGGVEGARLFDFATLMGVGICELDVVLVLFWLVLTWVCRGDGDAEGRVEWTY